jgi:phosphate:Na+ symporter
VIGTFIFIILFFVLKYILMLGFFESAVNATSIAVVHSIFNIACTVILYPFHKFLAKLATITIKDKKEEGKRTLLDERFLSTPSFAITQCRKVTEEMAEISRKALFCALENYNHYDEKKVETILGYERQLDDFEDQIGNYLVKLSAKGLNAQQSHHVGELLHVINDFERIGDHAVNILESTQEMRTKQICFSSEGSADMTLMMNAIVEVVNLAVKAFIDSDIEIAKKVEPLEDVIDALHVELRARHIERLQKGGCTIVLGFIFMDILANFERVSDHCSNIALCILQLELGSFTMHGYIDEMKTAVDEKYQNRLSEYAAKYDVAQNYLQAHPFDEETRLKIQRINDGLPITGSPSFFKSCLSIFSTSK